MKLSGGAPSPLGRTLFQLHHDTFPNTHVCSLNNVLFNGHELSHFHVPRTGSVPEVSRAVSDCQGPRRLMGETRDLWNNVVNPVRR